MTKHMRLAAVLFATALVTAGCLDFSPPEPTGAAPTRTPTPTYTPEPTATELLVTATSTSTPTPTPSTTPTAFVFNPFASPSPGAPGTGLTLATPPVGLGTPLPSAAGPASGVLPVNPGSGTFLPPVPNNPPPSSGSSSSGATTGGTTGGVSAPDKTPTPVSWNCNGDERLEFVPDSPIVGDDVLITVTSAKSLGYTLLVGSPPLERVQDGRGGPGYFWQWKRKMDKAGSFTFEFFAGPRKDSRCIAATVRVGAIGPAPTATLVPLVIPTPTPTRTPRPDH